jgi:hypothetical protein
MDDLECWPPVVLNGAERMFRARGWPFGVLWPAGARLGKPVCCGVLAVPVRGWLGWIGAEVVLELGRGRAAVPFSGSR